MKYTILLLCSLCLLLIQTTTTIAGVPEKTNMINYAISWQQPNSHLFEITIQTTSDGAEYLDFALPNWRPGRYLIQNYARNIQEFRATDGQGQTLPWQKTAKALWRVQTNRSANITIHYKYYANILDAGASQLNEQEAYFNGTNLFMYLPEHRNLPCRLKIQTPANWQIATALKTEANTSFLAQNYDELADSPVIASPTLKTQEFKVGDTTYHIVFQGRIDYDLKTIGDQLAKIVTEQTKIFGGKAPFEHYWFLYHILPNLFWHGVEHSYSTSITMPANAFNADRSRQTFYSVSSHELFHAWNVKRIRPQIFVNPDYSQEAYTKMLWFCEGVTSYYGNLAMKRAGIIDEKAYLAGLESVITELQTAPGRLINSAEEASFNGWLQPDNPENVQISFYTKGELLGLLWDLAIRKQTNNRKSLDDVMLYLYEEYGKNDRGVPEDGLQKATETITGSSFTDFFAHYVAGYQELAYNDYLAIAGLNLIEEVDKARSEAYLGMRVSNEDRATINNVVPGSPAAMAGLDRGDLLVAINGAQANGGNLSELLMGYHPDDHITVTVFRNRQLRNFDVTLGKGGNINYLLKHMDSLNEVQQSTLKAWLK